MTITVITGANKGIGFETARQLLAQGHTVYLGARDSRRGRQAAETLGARPLLIDITDDRSVRAAAETVKREAGHVDVLVNNAGISGPLASAGALTAADFSQVYDTNVFGAVRTMHAFLPLLSAADEPAVVNVSSGLGSIAVNADPAEYVRVVPDWHPLPAYNSSKAALNMVTVLYAQAYPAIRTNAVDPGFTATDLNGHQGTQNVREGAAVIVETVLSGGEGVSGRFLGAMGTVPW